MRIHKVDAGAHGDDHLFPGPVDIAWDLAGAIVEWDLDAGARHGLLAAHARVSGDRAESRIEAYLTAYRGLAAARAAMARVTLSGDDARRSAEARDPYLAGL